MLHLDNWALAIAYSAMALAFAFGYLCGSIPFGLIITRLAGTADIRAIGSGNIGATNVLRTGRKELAAATLLGDMLKGTFAVLVAEQMFACGCELLISIASAGQLDLRCKPTHFLLIERALRGRLVAAPAT